MASRKTAKQIAEDALSTIGAFPASQAQADEGELKKAMNWLEMLLNSMAGIKPLAGFWMTIDIPLEAGEGDYLLSDYHTEAETQHVFSVGLVQDTGDVTPLPLIWEDQANFENLEQTGAPQRVCATRDLDPYLKVYPKPTQTEEDAGLTLRVRIQTLHEDIDNTGTGDADIRLRPSWYLMLIKKLSYEIGMGPVRRLPEGELKRLQDDADRLENQLLARDGQYNTGSPPSTEPMAGWDADMDNCAPSSNGYSRRY